ARTLLGFGPDARAALPALREAVRTSKSAGVWLNGLYAIDAIKSNDPATIPVLIELLQSGDSKAQLLAATFLSGPRARHAIPALLEAAKTGDYWVRAFAIGALERIDCVWAAKSWIETV